MCLGVRVFSIIKKISPIKMDYDLKILYEITRNCNMRCSYCDVFRNEEIFSHENSVDYINSLLKVRPKILTTLYGGEPTQHPNFFKIADSIKTDLGIFTNLSADEKFYFKLQEYANLTSFETTLHWEYVDVEEFFNKIKIISNRRNDVVYRVFNNYSEKNRDRVAYWEEKFKSLGVLTYHFPINCYVGDYYLKEAPNTGERVNVLYLDGHCHQVDIAHVLGKSFYRYKCSAGSNTLYISSDGRVFPCSVYRTRNNKSYFKVESSLKNNVLEETLCSEKECCDYDSTKTLVFKNKKD